MTQEDKDLLLKDICARLPYETKCAIYGASGTIMKDKETIFYTPWPNIITFEGYERNECYMYWQVKPYLRPMSSMTEEEREELKSLCKEDLSEFAEFIQNGHGLSQDGLYMFDKQRQFDWLNANYFDYRGLIPKGLAIEAPEEMY